MFEKEIQFIVDFNLNKIKSLSSSFIFDELFRVELHPALIKYISGRLDLLFYEERKILLENSRFDYSGAKIAEYFNLISVEIKKTKKLSYSEVEDYIKKGVVFNANFCIQPKSTLTNLIFKNTEKPKSTAEIKVYLNFIYYYDYFKKIINSYISKRKIVSLGKDEFMEILDKIDSELLTSKRGDFISDALNSISDFYNDGGITKSSVQPSLVEAYLKEKNLNEMIELLHKEVKDKKKKVNIEELKKILFTKRVIKGELPEEKAIEDEIEKRPEAETLPEIEPAYLPDGRTERTGRFEEEKGSVSVKPGFHKKDEEKINKEEKTKEEEKNEEDKEVVDEFIESKVSGLEIGNKQNDPDEKEIILEDDVEEKEIQELILEEEIIEDEEIENKIEDEELIEEYIPATKEIKREKDIFSFLSKKEIDKIVSVIFNDDEDDFANTMEKISECRGYEQASKILKSVFFSYRVNPYKREAVSLTNAVSNYFHQGN
jgi:hypothetical protein